MRKRSFQRVRGAQPIKLEELAKIRFAYFYEPTRCIADPRSLWTGSEDGGYYEHAFGIDGDLLDGWTDEQFYETLFATVVFLELSTRIKKLIKQDRSKYFFLQRLRYWALSLSALHLRAKKSDYRDVLEASAKFDKWFDEFWRDIFRDLVAAFQAAQSDRISNFALARSESRWNNIKHQVDLVLGANLNG